MSVIVVFLRPLGLRLEMLQVSLDRNIRPDNVLLDMIHQEMVHINSLLSNEDSVFVSLRSPHRDLYSVKMRAEMMDKSYRLTNNRSATLMDALRGARRFISEKISRKEE